MNVPRPLHAGVVVRGTQGVRCEDWPLERVRDSVFVEGLLLRTLIGVDADELLQPQPVLIDVELGIDHLDAGRTDCLVDALDYGAVRRRLMALASSHRVKLLEAFAELVAETLLREFGACRVRVRVCKPNKFPDVHALGVTIERRLAGAVERPRLGLAE